MLSEEEKQEIRRQVNLITGQLQAVAKMLEEDRSVQDIYIQFKAVEGLLNKALYTILDDLFRKKLAATIAKVMNECYFEDCPHCGNIESVKKEFVQMNLGDVLKNLSRLEHCNLSRS